MATDRRIEIKRRRHRKVKLKKLRARYKEAKSAIDREKVTAKVSKIAPWLSEEEFAGTAPKKK